MPTHWIVYNKLDKKEKNLQKNGIIKNKKYIILGTKYLNINIIYKL